MSLPLLPFLWQQFVFVRHADGNGLLSLLAKLLASLGKFAHCKLRHGQALDNLPLATRAGDWEAEHHPLWCGIRPVRKYSH